MNTLGKRIRLARGKMSQEEYSKALGISKGSLGFYERDENLPNTDVVLKICSLSGVAIPWLILGDGPMKEAERDEIIKNYFKNHECDNNPDLIMIPRVAARLCAGTGSLETDDNIVGMYAFRSDWILKKGNTKRMVLMDVTGDSMAPDIKHGDIVLIDQSKTDIYGHGYYAVGIDDVIFLKEVLIEPGVIILRSLNKDYEDIRVDRQAEQADTVRIIGRVLWVAHELD